MTAAGNGVRPHRQNHVSHGKAHPSGVLKAETKRTRNAASSGWSGFAPQDRRHHATGTVGANRIEDGLPITCHSLSKQFQHAALEANEGYSGADGFIQN